MSNNIVAQKYAKAAYEQLNTSGKAADFGVELVQVAKLFDKSAIQFFQNPFNEKADKINVINQSFEGKVSNEMLSFLRLVASKSRMNFISEMSTEYSNLVRNAAGLTRGKIYSPVDLTPEFIKQVADTLTDTLKKKIELDFEKDESLIAGFKVQVGGWTIDDSASAHLNKIKEDLMKRGL